MEFYACICDAYRIEQNKIKGKFPSTNELLKLFLAIDPVCHGKIQKSKIRSLLH